VFFTSPFNETQFSVVGFKNMMKWKLTICTSKKRNDIRNQTLSSQNGTKVVQIFITLCWQKKRKKNIKFLFSS